MKIANYIGRHVSKFLQSMPFKDWQVERSVEDDLDEQIIHYVFKENGLELRCDSDENISVIFMQSEENGGFDESLSELSFSLKREQVQERFGVPSKQGEKINDSILGECGAWDRFSQAGFTVHIEYKVSKDEFNMITIMRNDVVP